MKSNDRLWRDMIRRVAVAAAAVCLTALTGCHGREGLPAFEI